MCRTLIQEITVEFNISAHACAFAHPKSNSLRNGFRQFRHHHEILSFVVAPALRGGFASFFHPVIFRFWCFDWFLGTAPSNTFRISEAQDRITCQRFRNLFWLVQRKRSIFLLVVCHLVSPVVQNRRSMRVTSHRGGVVCPSFLIHLE